MISFSWGILSVSDNQKHINIRVLFFFQQKISFDNAIENSYMGLFTAIQSAQIKLLWVL